MSNNFSTPVLRLLLFLAISACTKSSKYDVLLNEDTLVNFNSIDVNCIDNSGRTLSTITSDTINAGGFGIEVILRAKLDFPDDKNVKPNIFEADTIKKIEIIPLKDLDSTFTAGKDCIPACIMHIPPKTFTHFNIDELYSKYQSSDAGNAYMILKFLLLRKPLKADWYQFTVRITRTSGKVFEYTTTPKYLSL